MPWPTVTEPSLGLGILKAQLTREGIKARVFHAYVDLLRHVTFETYAFVSSCWGLNEFVFTKGLDAAPDEKQLECLGDECIERIRANQKSHSKYRDARSLADLFLRLRDEIIPAYLAECADHIAAQNPTMVGFTCMFDQSIASVALAQAIKQRLPHVLIGMGGYALEGPPGRQIITAFPWVDCVVRGDGEPVVGDLARCSVGRVELKTLPGIVTRATNELAERPPIRVSMDDSPDPDYRDWFADLARLRARDEVEIRGSTLPVESSRGCWYGQARHCIFCGIDDETMKYRSKSPPRVLEMLASLREAYGDHNFRFNDYILPSTYYKTLLIELAKVRPSYRLQCEIKANQSPARLRLFKAAGFTDLQPGIESFSSEVLRLVDKGVRGIQNVLTLKTGYVNGLVIHYNILYGIPGEKPEYYFEMLKGIPRLYHLQPPVSRAETEVTRGAPLQTAPRRFGILTSLEHARLYDVLFSTGFHERTRFDLDDYAYYFERPFDWGAALAELHLQLVIQINHWKTRHRREDVVLGYRLRDGGMIFTDTRFGESETVTLTERDAAVYMCCDTEPSSVTAIARRLGGSVEEVEAALARLDKSRLIWREADEVLGLGVDMPVVEEHVSSRWKRHWTSLLS